MYIHFGVVVNLAAKAMAMDEQLFKTLAIHGGHETRQYVQQPWSRESVLAGLRRNLDMQLTHGTVQYQQELKDAIDNVPDDATCANIGWFVSGFQLAESFSQGVLANNDPEVHINVLTALDPSRLSESVLESIHEDIERFELLGVPLVLEQAAEAAVKRRERRFQQIQKRRKTVAGNA